MAPEDRWREHQALLDGDTSRVFLTRSRSKELRQHVFNQCKRPHPEAGAAPLDDRSAEFIFAYVLERSLKKGEVRKLNIRADGAPVRRSATSNQKAFFDVVFEHKNDASRNVGWEVKTLNNRHKREEVVLMNIKSVDIGLKGKMGAHAIAEQVFAKAREKQAEAEAAWDITDSRSLFFWGEGTERMLIWQEPYYPGEIEVDSLEWKLTGQKTLVGSVDGKPVWTWYPRNGQLKHKVHVPEGTATAVKLPDRAWTLEEYNEMQMIGEKLIAVNA